MPKKNKKDQIQACPNCNSRGIVKRGKKKTKISIKQVYLCKNCSRHFTETPIKFKTYPAKTILAAISLYNLGNPILQIPKLIKKKHDITLTKSTVHRWIKEYSLPYTRYRKNHKIRIIRKNFHHHNLNYKLQYHLNKLNYFNNQNIIDYILGLDNWINTYFNSVPVKN